MQYVQYDQVDGETQKRLEQLFSVPRRKYWYKKRIFDEVVSVVFVLVLAPVFLLIAVLIAVDDPRGHVIFRQTRIGRHGKPFTLYKFRTMVQNAEAMRRELEQKNEMDGPVFKLKDDPRITRVGRILRQTSLDELPQLWNVLKGDMSMVGPRPPLPEEVDAYNDYQRLRLLVTPGLTCYWQTSALRNDISFAQWVEMDLEYIEHRSMWLDLKLIFRTVWAMLRRHGR